MIQALTYRIRPGHFDPGLALFNISDPLKALTFTQQFSSVLLPKNIYSEIAGLFFRKAILLITKEDTISMIDIDQTSSSTSNLDEKSLSKEDFFAITDDFKTNVLPSIYLFDST